MFPDDCLGCIAKTLDGVSLRVDGFGLPNTRYLRSSNILVPDDKLVLVSGVDHYSIVS